MKNALYYLAGELIISLVVSLGMNGGFGYDYLTTFGLVNIIIAVIGLIVGVIVLALNEISIGRGILISSGLLLLIGFAACSAFPMKFGS